MSTASEKWAAMEPRERDRWIDNHVFDGCELWLPHFTTDASADYLVLCRVRETWADPAARRNERSLLYMFAEHLHEMQYARKDGCMGSEITPVFYQPGDYSAAAYLALSEPGAAK